MSTLAEVHGVLNKGDVPFLTAGGAIRAITSGLLLLATIPLVNAAEERPPNVLLILADDLGWGELGVYGAQDVRTPHLDGLIRGGMRLTNFYANSSVCSPTRAALLSGRYPDRVGVPGVIRTHADNSWGHLAADATLLPKVLAGAGYQTAMVGKWHLGLAPPNTPNARGFDHVEGFLGDMMDDYLHHRRHDINYLRRNEVEIDPPGHATDLFTDWACRYVTDRRSDARPFFLYLAYNAPHTPIQPPAEWLKRVREREPGIAAARASLVALIEHLDDGVGRVLDTLAEAGLAENTLVLFTSDNGGQLSVGAANGPHRDGKQSMYEGGLKVVCGARWPGQIEAESESEFRAMSMDLFPTICDAAGTPPPEGIDGVSMLPTLLGQRQPPLREEWYFVRREGGSAYGGKTIEALIRGDWKLLQNSPFAPLELYNLKDDPREAHNRAQQAPKIFNDLSAALRRHIQRAGAVRWQERVEVSDER